MIFQLHHSQSLLQGRLDTERPGPAVILDLAGTPYTALQVAFVLPDDEAQAEKIRTAGFQTHTPLSVNLGAGATHP